MKVMILDHPRPFSSAHINDVANAPLSASLNSGYAAAIAEQAGCEVVYKDFYCTDASVEEMVSAVILESPEVLLVHWVYTWDDCTDVKSLVASVRDKSPKIEIIAFGLFPTLCRDDLLTATPGLGHILSGEFEGALFDLLTRLRGTPAALQTLPIPKDLGTAGRLRHMNVASSRGCYGTCSFCFIPPFYGRSRWSGRTPEEVLQEIDERRSRRTVEQIYFVDPNFFGPGAAGQERACRIGDGLAERGLTFGLEARVNDIHSDTIAHLKSCGLESVFLGIESASPAVLKRMRKGITPELSIHALQILRSYAVDVYAGFLMFEADSMMEDLLVNYEFLENNSLLETPDITVNMLYHNQIVLKGSPAYRKLDADGRLKKNSDTPYEAEIVYADTGVDMVQKGMREVAQKYFTMGRLSVKHHPSAEVNECLKQGFLTLCHAASRR